MDSLSIIIISSDLEFNFEYNSNNLKYTSFIYVP